MTKDSQKTVLGTAMAASFITPFTLSAVNIALPDIAGELSLTANDLAWLSLAFLISSTALIIPMGKLADFYGRVKIFRLGFFFLAFFSLLGALAADKNQLIAARFFQGAASAMIFSTAVAIISSAFERGERGKAIGLAAGSVYLGLTMGPVLGGLLTEKFSWRSIFYLGFLISFVVSILINKKIKTEWKGNGEKINFSNMAFYFFAVLLLVYASTNPIKHLPLFLFSVILFALYFLMERKNPIPFLDFKKILLNRIFCFAVMAAFFHYAATFSISFLMSLYLRYSSGFSPWKAGLVLFSMPFFMMILSPAAGRLSDKKSAGLLSSGGIALTILAFLPLLKISPAFPLPLLILLLSLTGIGFAFFSSPNTNQVMSSLEADFYSTGSGILSSMRVMGQNFSMSAANTVFYFYFGDKSVASDLPAFFKSFKIIMAFSVLALAGALFFSLKRVKT